MAKLSGFNGLNQILNSGSKIGPGSHEVWKHASLAAIEAIEHSNKYNHAPDKIIQLYTILLNSTYKKISESLKNAVWCICAIELIHKQGKITSKFNKSYWQEIQKNKEELFGRLVKFGLNEFKPIVRRGSKKNPITAKSIHEYRSNGIVQLMDKVKSLEGDQGYFYLRFLEELEDLERRLTASYESLSK